MSPLVVQFPHQARPLTFECNQKSDGNYRVTVIDPKGQLVYNWPFHNWAIFALHLDQVFVPRTVARACAALKAAGVKMPAGAFTFGGAK